MRQFESRDLLVSVLPADGIGSDCEATQICDCTNECTQTKPQGHERVGDRELDTLRQELERVLVRA